MTDKLEIDPKTSALLVMDYQNSIVEGLDGKDELLSRTAKLLAAARKAKMFLAFVVVAFRPGYPEASPRNPAFAAIRGSGRLVQGEASAEVHEALRRLPSDVVITKRRVGAFSGSDLEVVLRAQGIETMILAGVATSGVVLSTLRHAADADYRIVVARDCCADRDPEVHRVLLDKVFPKQATVTTSDAVVAALG